MNRSECAVVFLFCLAGCSSEELDQPPAEDGTTVETAVEDTEPLDSTFESAVDSAPDTAIDMAVETLSDSTADTSIETFDAFDAMDDSGTAPDSSALDADAEETASADTSVDSTVPETSSADTAPEAATDASPPTYPLVVDVNTSGGFPTPVASNAMVSGNGRYVAFLSYATDLVPGDTNMAPDVFVRDTWLGSTRRASVTSAGVQADYDSREPYMSSDGRWVVFASEAGNLCPGKTGFHMDIVRHDMVTGATDCVSVDPTGAPGTGESYFPSVSDDGRYVVFESSSYKLVAGAPLVKSVFVRDMTLGVTKLVSVDGAGVAGNGASYRAAISGDGRFVAFVSAATNLVSGDTNGKLDVFVRDLSMSKTERVSVSSTGAQGDYDVDFPAISSDGSKVIFSGNSTKLVAGTTTLAWDMYVRDRVAGTTAFVGPMVGSGNSIPGTKIGRSAVSSDLRYVGFDSTDAVLPGKLSSGYDVYVLDRTTGMLARANRTAAGNGSNGSSVNAALSGDGAFIAFSSTATDIVSAPTGGKLRLYLTTRP